MKSRGMRREESPHSDVYLSTDCGQGVARVNRKGVDTCAYPDSAYPESDTVDG